LSGRRRKSKKFGLPPNPAEPPLRKLTPRQDERASEAFLVSSLIAMLRWEWQLRVGAQTGTEPLEAWAPTLSKPTIRALEEGVEDLPDDPDEHDSGFGFALLQALTDRLLGLDLPATILGVFQGPPIVTRHRDPLLPSGLVLSDGTGD
jgi:hypothetical protein